MKNIGASAGVFPAQGEQKVEGKIEEEEEEEEEGEEYHPMENEMIFYLREAPVYRISAVGKWCENTAGKVIGDADVYFRHIMSGQRCESVRDCFTGWSECDERSTEKWDTLYYRISTMLLRDLRRIVCGEKKYEIHPI